MSICKSTLLASCFLMYLAICACDVRQASEAGLCNAVEAGNTNYLRQYLSSGGNPNRMMRYLPNERFQGSLLDLAIRSGQVAVVRELLRSGANPNLRDPQGETPLRWLIARVKSDVAPEAKNQICKLILDSGADPNLAVTTAVGYTPLMDAANLGCSQLVSDLIAIGADVNATNANGYSALNLAKSADIANSLLAAGAAHTLHVGQEWPAETAVKLGHVDALSVLTNTDWGFKETTNR